MITDVFDIVISYSLNCHSYLGIHHCYYDKSTEKQLNVSFSYDFIILN